MLSVPSTLRAFALVGAAWLAMGLLLLGIGLLAERAALRCRPHSAADLFAAFWSGWATVTAAVLLWNFLAPVDSWLFALLAAAALAGFAVSAGPLRAIITRRRPRGEWLVLAAGCALIALLIADRALLPTGNLDLGYYYLPTLRWAASYRVVPGLANLLVPLGYNSTQYLMGALVEAGPVPVPAPLALNSLLVAALLAQALVAAIRLVRAAEPARHADLLLVLMVPGVLGGAMGRAMPLGADLAVLLAGAVLSVELLSMLERDGGPQDARRRLLRLAALAAAGLSLKLTFAAFGAATLGVALGVFVRRVQADPRIRRAGLLGVGALAALMVAPWMLRGVILSGYLLFPLPLLPMPVAWRVPLGVLAMERASARATVFAGGLRPATAAFAPGWPAAWLARYAGEVMMLWMPVGLALGGALALGALAWVRHERLRPAPDLWLLVPAGVGLAVWAIAIPAPRFAGIGFWLLAALALSGLLRAALRRTSRALPAAAMILTLALCGLALRGLQPVDDQEARAALRTGAPPTYQVLTESGLALFVPVSSVQCRRASLPCTPFPDRFLRLCRPGDLAGGFVVSEQPVSCRLWP